MQGDTIDVGTLVLFSEKCFARGAERTQIACCDRLGLQMDEFVELALRAMQNISTELGL